MTYHPKEIMKSALFLATKTENHYTPLKTFVSQLPKTTAEGVIATEFLVTQGLRYTLDVRHPYRALEGGFMELKSFAEGKARPIPGKDVDAAAIRKDMMKVPRPDGSTPEQTPAKLTNRIQNAHSRVKDILKTAALLTDAY